jgi:hypothetical protein
MKKNVQAQLKKKEIFLQHLVYKAISVVISWVLLCMAIWIWLWLLKNYDTIVALLKKKIK